MIKHVTEENFEKEISKERILVDFYATWCGPCKMLGMVMEKFDKKGIIDIVKVDVDGAPNLSSKSSFWLLAPFLNTLKSDDY